MKTRLLLLLFTICEITNAQSPSWVWADRAGGSESDAGNGITTDVNGNVYVTGSFAWASITFGPMILTNAGDFDIFIVKYDASANVLWANSAGAGADDRGQSIATDASGNVYVTGFFWSNSITFGSTTLTKSGAYDIFTVKYDASGNVLWAKKAGGTSQDFSYGITTDATGNVYVTGSFDSPTLYLGSTNLNNPNPGNPDIFVVKYDASGNVLWANSAGGTMPDGGNGITADASGNIYVTGSFASSLVTFGSTNLTNTNAGNSDIFTVKFDSAGAVLWANSVGGTGGTLDEGGGRVCSDASGNLYVTGGSNSASITFGSTTLTNPGLFVVKYDISANVLWAKNAPGGAPNGSATDASGNVYVTGSFYSSVTFGSIVLTNPTYDPSDPLTDIFTAKLGPPVGVNEIALSNFISIYPNPFSAQTTLRTTEHLSNATLTMYNCFGQTVKEIKNLNGQAIAFNRDNLASGLYFVRFTQDNQLIATAKLTISD